MIATVIFLKRAFTSMERRLIRKIRFAKRADCSVFARRKTEFCKRRLTGRARGSRIGGKAGRPEREGGEEGGPLGAAN